METRKIAVTPVYQKLDAAYRSGRYNVFVMEGGSRSSKTYSIIQFWIKYALEHQDRTRRVIVSRQKATWITATVLKDFIDILKDYGLYNTKRHNKSIGAGIYTLFTTEFWFLGLDDEQRIHGMKSDAFWINEAVEASFNDYAQLMQRCSGFAILDYNPSYEEHWIYDKICRRGKSCYIHSTMLDNPLIPDNAREQILSYEPTERNIEQGTADKRKWQIYGLGLRARLEGLIFEKVSVIKDIPPYVKRRWRGMDFGFTNDPTAIETVAFHNDCLYIDEECYATHMVTADIISIIKELPDARTRRIWADNAEQREITEMQNAGLPMMPVSKGAGSVLFGIDFMQGLRRIYITERSVNIKKEFDNYTWQQDPRTGCFINRPCDTYNHAIDGIRYVCWMELLGHANRNLSRPKSLQGYF